MIGQRLAVNDPCGWNRNAVTLDEGVEPVRCWATDGAEELVEATVNRCIGDRARVVNALHRLKPVLVDGLPLLIKEGHAHVPLAEKSGRVALVLQHAAYRRARFLDHAGAADTREDAAHPRPKSHASGQNAVARGCADSRRAVRIAEQHSLFRQPINVGGRDLGFGVVATDIPIAEVIGEDEDHIGPAELSRGPPRQNPPLRVSGGLCGGRPGRHLGAAGEEHGTEEEARSHAHSLGPQRRSDLPYFSCPEPPILRFPYPWPLAKLLANIQTRSGGAETDSRGLSRAPTHEEERHEEALPHTSLAADLDH